MRLTMIWILVGLFFLAGCSGPQLAGDRAGVAAGSEMQSAAVDMAELEQQARQLPGAQVFVGEGLRLVYPVGSLFEASAVVPTLQAPEYLPPLKRFLQRNAAWNWQIRLRAHTPNGEIYDRKLAAERQRMLLQLSSLPEGILTWELLSGPGRMIELWPATEP